MNLVRYQRDHINRHELQRLLAQHGGLLEYFLDITKLVD
jgi:hypothetical protein